MTSEIGTVLHMRDDHQRAHRGLQELVAVSFGPLILNKIRRLQHFADVVKISPDADEQAVTFVCHNEVSHLSPEPEEEAALGQTPE